MNFAHPARLERAIEDLESTGLPIKPKGVCRKGFNLYTSPYKGNPFATLYNL